MTFVKRNRARVLSVLALLLCALTMFSACQEPQQSIPGSVDSISVRVMDGMDSKTITPEGNVNISHYVITVVNEAEGINQSSGYLTKGSMFTVSNVPAGTWYAKVDAYIDRGEDTYVKVASDQSEPKTVQAGTSTTFELVLDTLDAVASGNVTVTLKMPTALSAESTAFWYQYTITGMTDEEFSHTSELLSGTTGADGLATITIDADAIGLMQGAYRFAITVQDAKTSPTLTRKGVDVMRLVNGLEAKGTIDLTTYEADQSFDVTITDKIGDILTPSLEDGKEVYNLDGQNGSASLTVTLAEPLKANETIEWYVDGELDETVNADEASSGKYILTFTPGSHIVTAIVRDTDTLMAVGSIDEFKVMIVAEFAEQVFTFELNNDRESYTVTGLIAPLGEFEMPESGVLKIPASYKGKPVTALGESTFKDRTDIIGSVVIPDSVTEIGKAAFKNCSSLESIDLPDNITSIAQETFYGCTSMKQLPDLDGIVSIESQAFGGCISLSGDLILPDSVKKLGTVSNSTSSSIYGPFMGCTGFDGTLDLGSVEEVGDHSFSGTNFNQIIFPSSLKKIGNYAFSGCGITSLNLPESLEWIGGGAFQGCDLEGVLEIPGSVKRIGRRAFSGVGGMKEPLQLVLHEGLEYIEEYAFGEADFTGDLIIPDSVRFIGASAFRYTGFGGILDLGNGVETIEGAAFNRVRAKNEVLVIPRSVTTLEGYGLINVSWVDPTFGDNDFKSIEFEEGSTLTTIPSRLYAAGLEYIKVPDWIEKMESVAVSSYAGSEGLIYIPESVKTMESGAKIGESTYNYTINIGTIYCETSSKPDGWAEDWAHENVNDIFWDVPEGDFDAIMNNDSVPYDVAEPVVGYDSETVTLSCDTSFAHIYYTLDGSEPVKYSTLYTEPFRHIGDFTLKAVAYVGNGIYSDVVTKPLSSVGAGGID